MVSQTDFSLLHILKFLPTPPLRLFLPDPASAKSPVRPCSGRIPPLAVTDAAAAATASPSPPFPSCSLLPLIHPSRAYVVLLRTPLLLYHAATVCAPDCTYALLITLPRGCTPLQYGLHHPHRHYRACRRCLCPCRHICLQHSSSVHAPVIHHPHRFHLCDHARFLRLPLFPACWVSAGVLGVSLYAWKAAQCQSAVLRVYPDFRCPSDIFSSPTHVPLCN